MCAMLLLWGAGSAAATISTAATAGFRPDFPAPPQPSHAWAASSAAVGITLGLLRRTHLHFSHASPHLLPFPPLTAVIRPWRHHCPHAAVPEGPSSSRLPLPSLARETDHHQMESGCGGDCGDNHNGNGKSNGKGWWGWAAFDSEGPSFPLPFLPGSWDESGLRGAFCSQDKAALASLLSLLLCCFWLPQKPPSSALAMTTLGSNNGSVTAWEVRGGEWTRLLPDPFGDAFVVVRREFGRHSSGQLYGLAACWHQCRDIFLRLMLPGGYPNSVSSDYLEYSLWRGAQGIASQISGVLSTQALLYAVGLGKGVIPAAAAVNWVLKDGIGYLSKILLSKYGRHFDVNPKGWRLFADLLENAAYGMEILTPAFPHLFVLIGSAAGAGRSAAALIQAATRSCFYAGFATQRNFAEVIAKGEAQGMVSKFLGIMLGIFLANYTGSSTPLALASFGAVTAIHMYCNLKSYQSIQLRTLNPYRASLVFSEYLLSGQVPLVKEVNAEEQLFPGLPFINVKGLDKGKPRVLSLEAKDAATQIDSRLQLGSKLSEVVNSKEEAIALFDLFREEGYMLVERNGRYRVVLKEGSSQEDMLKSLFHVNYLYWLERNVGIESRDIAEECRLGGRLQISLDYVQREFSHVRRDGQQHGWVTEGLIARPLPNRIRVGGSAVSAAPQASC